jgi:hypothetical protein
MYGLFHFICWLVAGKDNHYRIASTDIFSVALILENLGLEIWTTENIHNQFHESDVVVFWSNTVAPTALVKTQPVCRPGMRIHLAHIEEVASLFPVSADCNTLRSIFERGMDAVRKDELSLQIQRSKSNSLNVRESPVRQEDQDMVCKAESTS